MNEGSRSKDGGPEVVGTIIIMPEAYRAVVAAKLAEYEARLGRHQAEAALNPATDNVFQAPEAKMTGRIPNKQIGTIYKIELAKALLADRQVDTFALSRRLLAEHGGFNVDRFENAAGVMKSYCEGRRTAE